MSFRWMRLVAIFTLLPVTAASQSLNPNLPVTNFGAAEVAVVGDTVYVAGGFDRIGPAIGSFVGIDAAGSPLPPYPKVAGTVNCLTPDATGGWYIGGLFTAVGGQSRINLAQIDASGHLTAWNPGAAGEVYALLLYGTTLYVAGNISTLGAVPRSKLGAVDALTGLATPWNPQPDAAVTALAVRTSATAGAQLYAGGNFTSIAGQARSYLAVFDPTDGSLASWNPSLDGAVSAIASQSPRFGTPTLYIGGGFQTVDGQPRSRLASFNGDTGILTNWNPGANGLIRQILAPNGGPIYVCGDYTSIAASGRRFLTALDQTTGMITGFDPHPDARVYSILLQNGLVYAAGYFETIGSQSRRGLAALDGFGQATAWDPSPNDAFCQAIGANDAGIFVGGGFTSVGGVTRRSLASFHRVTGAITSWNPDVGLNGGRGLVNALCIQNGTAYVGGYFTTIGGLARYSLAAVDLATGLPTAWDPNAGAGTVYSLAISDNRVYAGGTFTTVGGMGRSGIAAVSLATGSLLPWAPVIFGHTSYAQEGVSDILPVGNTVYIAGDFTKVNFNARAGLAAVDTTGPGGVLPWEPSTGYATFPWVNSIRLDGARMIVGGSFSTMGGRARSNLAIIDVASGLATTLDPFVDGEVTGMALDGSTLYVSGNFRSIGLESRLSLGALNVQDASILPWGPPLLGSARSMVLTVDALYMGGGFYGVSHTSREGIAGFSKAILTGVEVIDGPPAPETSPRLRIAPNPFRDQTTVTLAMGTTAPVEIEVFDASGRRVRSVSRSAASSGVATFTWDGRSESGGPIGAGIYFVRARSGDVLRTAKILHVK